MDEPLPVQPLLESVAANVRRIRERRGMTQEKLAEAADLDLRQVSRIETARTNFAIGDLHAIATALGVRPAELLKARKFVPPKRGRPKRPKQ
jgi:transcriptional regulator with XRE-family HTH domain